MAHSPEDFGLPPSGVSQPSRAGAYVPNDRRTTRFEDAQRVASTAASPSGRVAVAPPDQPQRAQNSSQTRRTPGSPAPGADLRSDTQAMRGLLNLLNNPAVGRNAELAEALRSLAGMPTGPPQQQQQPANGAEQQPIPHGPGARHVRTVRPENIPNEVSLPVSRRRGTRPTALIQSCDRQDYTFRRIKPGAEKDRDEQTRAALLGILVTLAEIAKGCDPQVACNYVLSQWGVVLHDAEGNVFYDARSSDEWDTTPDVVYDPLVAAAHDEVPDHSGTDGLSGGAFSFLED